MFHLFHLFRIIVKQNNPTYPIKKPRPPTKSGPWLFMLCEDATHASPHSALLVTHIQRNRHTKRLADDAVGFGTFGYLFKLSFVYPGNRGCL